MSIRWIEPENGVYRIAALHTKKPWGVAGGSADEGAVVHQEPSSDQSSQLWRIQKVATASHKIVNLNSGLALTVTDGKQENNVLLTQAKYEGNDHQHFTFEQTRRWSHCDRGDDTARDLSASRAPAATTEPPSTNTTMSEYLTNTLN